MFTSLQLLYALSALAVQKVYATAVEPIAPANNPHPGATSDIDNQGANILTVLRGGVGPGAKGLGEQILNIVTLIAGILAVFYLVWAGIQYITAGGSPDKAKAARQGIINAIIGIIVIVAAYAIVRLAVSVGNSINNAV